LPGQLRQRSAFAEVPIERDAQLARQRIGVRDGGRDDEQDSETIHARHLNLSFRDPQPSAPSEDSPWTRLDLSGTLSEASRRILAEVERRKIEQALEEAAGNRNRAAELLQVSYKTFIVKLKEYGLDGG
jgi:DNA-binding NtrC family response regulator